MRVTVKAFAHFREMLGTERVVELEEGSTLRDLINRLTEAHEDMREAVFSPEGLREDVIIMRNRKNVDSLDGIETVLAEGDEIAIFPPVAGG